jgi:acyl-CoA reductase-like NAD-dependent aldehyde dehydrogenase
MSTVERQSPDTGRNGGPDAPTIAVENPATGEIVGHVPDMGAEQVAGLARRARAAQPAWNALGFDGRAEVMRDVREWLIDNRDRMIQTIVDETGKTREDAQLAEIFLTADALGFWAKRAAGYLADERIRSLSPLVLGKKLVLRYRPFGLIGVIGPWNYPLANSFGDAIPALMAGNSVLMKPSEVTPMSMLLMEEGLRASGMPEDVFVTVTGGGATGTAVVDESDMVMFTGSTATGRKVMARAAETLTPVSLELGGKDPMIVLRDADLERAANAAVYGGMSNGGQICISVERVYVEEPVYEEFLGKVVEKVRALRQGRPGEAGSVDVGAVTFAPQVEIIERHLKDALDKGARVVVGGKLREGEGRFFEPTVLTDVDHTMECMTEETFGPTLPVMKVRDEDEAVRLANDSRYGLNSSVWTRDTEKGERVADRLEAGGTCVNDANVNYGIKELPFGGWNESGVGYRHGPGGIRKYCRTHSLVVTRVTPKKDINQFPYSKRVTKAMERAMVLAYGRGAKKKRR